MEQRVGLEDEAARAIEEMEMLQARGASWAEKERLEYPM